MATLAQRVFEVPWFVAAYDRLRESPGAWVTCGMTFRREVEVHAAALGGATGGTFLEVACGQGSFGVEIARLLAGARFVGLDRSGAQLARAGEKARRRGADGAYHRLQGDALRLPFADGVFDGALCVGGLHQIPRPEDAVVEMARVVRAGGVVAGACFVLPPAASRPVGMNAMTLDEVRGWLVRAGLADVSCRRSSPIWCVFSASGRR